jgi:hypothetical protein
MAEHAGEEESDAEHAHLDDEIVRDTRIGDRPCHHAEPCGKGREKKIALVPARAIEAEDEGEQVDGKRRNPEQWHRRDVLRDVIGDSKQQQRSRSGERAPQHLSRDRRWRLARRFTDIDR